MLDISKGKEPRRIPVFNEVDDEQPPTNQQLEYIRYSTACTYLSL